MQEYMKIWIGEAVVGSVGTDGTILDAAGLMVGHIYLYTGEVSVGDAVAGEAVVGSVSHEGDIYDDNGKVGDIARSGNIWDFQGEKVGWVAPLQYWKTSITLYESYDAPVLLAGGAALLLVLRPTRAATITPATLATTPMLTKPLATRPILRATKPMSTAPIAIPSSVAFPRMYPHTIPLSSYGYRTTVSLAYI